MLYVCVRDVMDVVFSVCIVTHGAVGTRIWGMGILQSRSHDGLRGSHEYLLLFTPILLL